MSHDNGRALEYRDISRKYGGPYLAHAAYLDSVRGQGPMTPEETGVFGSSLDPQILQTLALERSSGCRIAGETLGE